MARFMQDGRYNQWQSQETNPHRILELDPDDPETPENNVQNRQGRLQELLVKRRRQLKRFLGQVAQCTSKNLYAAIVRHATSLEWIYTKIREDYDIQKKGIHFLNIVELKYDPEKKTPAGFYNEYRTIVINNVGRRNKVIH